MTRSRTTEVSVLALSDGSRGRRTTHVVTEGALEIRVAGQPPLVVLRTPGDDVDLAAGMLVGRGLAARASDVTSIRMAPDHGSEEHQGVDVTLAPRAGPEPAREAAAARFDTGVLGRLPGRLGSALRQNAGELYGVGLFLPNGDLLCARQDVVPRNAVAKVVGWALREGLLPLRRGLLLTLGTLTADAVQTAVAAGISVVACTHAPTSLAVELAQDSGLGLVGQVRESSMDVYAGSDRLRRPRATPAGGCGEPWCLVRSQDGSMRVDLSSPPSWERLCAALGVDPALADPVDGAEPFEVVTARWTTSELLVALDAEGVTAAVVGLDNSGAVQ
jgi:FdhD protein